MFLRTVEMAFARYQAKGEAAALAIVFDRTAPELLRVARHLAPRPDDGEDLVQATFLAAIGAAKSHERGRPVLPWLLGILANQARSERRQTRRVPDPKRVRGEVIADVHGEVAERELRRELSAAIAGLPEVYRPVLRLWFEHGLEAQEISSALERPAGTVRAQISRGLDMLRRTLPPSLAGGAAVAVVAGRGLAAVRQSVLANCASRSSGFVSALAIGGLLMLHHKLLAAGALLAVSLLTWFAMSPPAAAPADSGSNEVLAAAAGGVGTSRDVTNQEVQRLPVAPPVPVETPVEVPTLPETVVVVRLRSATDQRPLVGYGVALRRLNEITNLAVVPAFRETDREGAVRFVGVEQDQWLIEIDRLGGAGVVEVVTGTIVEQSVDLPDTVVVEGSVLDPTGQPVAGADIVVQGSRLASPRVAVTDALGRFEVTHVAGIELQARKRGFAPSLARFVQGQPGQRLSMSLELLAGGRHIAGRAVNADGVAIAHGVVAIVPDSAKRVTPWDRETPQARPIWLRTDADGQFRTDEASPGLHVVVACATDLVTAPAYGRADTNLTNAWIDLRSEPATIIEGTVQRNGQPVAGVDITAWPEQCAADIGSLLNLIGMRRAVTGRDGVFRIVGTLPGELVLRASQGMSVLGDARRTIAAGAQTRWDLSLGATSSLKIRVTAATALPDRLMAFVQTKTSANAAPALVALANGKGECTSAREGPVDVVLAVLPGGRNIMQLARRSDVAASESEVHIELSADELPKSMLRGRLVDGASAPVAAAWISVRRLSGQGEPTLVVVMESTTATDGAFSIGPLPAGTYVALAGSLTESTALGNFVVTAARDEDAGDLLLPGR